MLSVTQTYPTIHLYIYCILTTVVIIDVISYEVLCVSVVIVYEVCIIAVVMGIMLILMGYLFEHCPKA